MTGPGCGHRITSVRPTVKARVVAFSCIQEGWTSEPEATGHQYSAVRKQCRAMELTGGVHGCGCKPIVAGPDRTISLIAISHGSSSGDGEDLTGSALAPVDAAGLVSSASQENIPGCQAGKSVTKIADDVRGPKRGPDAFKRSIRTTDEAASRRNPKVSEGLGRGRNKAIDIHLVTNSQGIRRSCVSC